LPDEYPNVALPAVSVRAAVIENASSMCQCSGCSGNGHPGKSLREKTKAKCYSTFEGADLPDGWEIDPLGPMADDTDPAAYRVLCRFCTKSWADLFAVAEEHDENP
jgi:hypothetical protein